MFKGDRDRVVLHRFKALLVQLLEERGATLIEALHLSNDEKTVSLYMDTVMRSKVSSCKFL